MPQGRRNHSFRSVTAALTLGLVTLSGFAAPEPAAADQKHVVRAGQSLGIIAKQYGSSISTLAAANGLQRDGILREGQVLTVPGEATVVRVAAGQSLGQIARDNHVSIAALAAANHIQPESTLQIGQRLVLPAGSGSGKAAASAEPQAASKSSAATESLPPKAAAVTTAPKAASTTTSVGASPKAATGITASTRATDPAEIAAAAKAQPNAAKTPTRSQSIKFPWGKPKQSGVVTLYRIWSRESLNVRLVDGRGRTRQEARRALREFLRPRESKRRKMPNTRLLSLLARVSDHFGGRPIHVVSGYRLAKGLTRKTSRHVAGEAIDFRIPGVPLTTLRDYCQQLSDVGVGYYPTTQFVHLDVRKQPARWTDWSLPGQPPVLVEPRRGNDDNDDGDDGKDELIAPASPEEKTAEHKHDEESARADSPTG